MRLLANENFPGAAVAAIRADGHDIIWVRTDSPGSSDQDVVRRSIEDDRVLITFDKDFGELAFRLGLAPPCGVILFRISTPSAERVAEVARAVLRGRSDWQGNFAVITDERIRLRALPGT